MLTVMPQSVMIINHEGEALQAQLPYILTSVFCIAFDVMVRRPICLM